jgi:hypothetical protein
MTIIKFPTQPKEPLFFKDVREDGYHIYSLKNAKKPNCYAPELPDYSGVLLKDLKGGDTITVRVFFGIGNGKNMRVDGGYLDLKVEHIEDDSVSAVILTQLPEEFALSTGGSIEVFQEEILYKANEKERN